MSHELITRVCAQLTQYHQLLDEISGADLSDMKNTEGRKKIAELRKALSAGRKKTAEANKAGLRNLDTTKEPRKKRVSSEEEDEPNKRPREMDVEFGSPEFIDDLKTRPFDGSHDIDTFLEKMMAISGSARKSILTVGLSLVMHGVVAASAEEYTKSFDLYKHSELVRKALSLPVEDISSLTTEDLVDIYIGTSPNKGGDPIEVRTLTGLFQHVQQSLGSLRFIINWSAISKKQNPNLAKNEVMMAIFCRQQNLDSVDMVDKDSDEWNLFASRAKDYRRGAARLFLAYKLLGSLVIFCPQLPLHYFHDGTLGMQLKNVIEELGGVFQEHSEMFKKREVGHRLLLRTLLKMFSKGNTLIEVVDDLEQASSKVTVVTD